MNTIDMRSDTVTLPTPNMRAAMAKAAVGDDVYKEDPTINLLQEKASDLMGMEAGLFVPSGTMGNLVAVLSHCQRGDEVIMGDKAHTFLFEAGGISALGGVFAHTIPNQPDGTLELDAIRNAIRPNDIHQPPSRLLILENTQNRCGGVVLTPEYINEAAEIAHQNQLKLHIDGARIFNASSVLKIDTRKIVENADSVTFCLSKGLCSPVGSVLCGSLELIEKARRLRKMLGGGMRQAGILAAAGLVALDEMIVRLEEDHQRARSLAEGLITIPGIQFDMGLPQTNMVFISMNDQVNLTAGEVVKQLASQNIRIGLTGERSFRLVTHAMISDEDIKKTIQIFQTIMHASS